VLHRNNAARRKSRLMKRLQTSGQPVAAVSTPAPAKGSSKSTTAAKGNTRTKAAGKR
jgi:hypothetical protein